jgi:hypothetical protein
VASKDTMDKERGQKYFCSFCCYCAESKGQPNVAACWSHSVDTSEAFSCTQSLLIKVNTCPAVIRVAKYIPITCLETGFLYCWKNITLPAELNSSTEQLRWSEFGFYRAGNKVYDRFLNIPWRGMHSHTIWSILLATCDQFAGFEVLVELLPSTQALCGVKFLFLECLTRKMKTLHWGEGAQTSCYTI